MCSFMTEIEKVAFKPKQTANKLQHNNYNTLHVSECVGFNVPLDT